MSVFEKHAWANLHRPRSAGGETSHARDARRWAAGRLFAGRRPDAWQLAALLSCGASLVLAYALISTPPQQALPFLIEVDPRGRPTALGTVTGELVVEDRHIAAQLAELVRWVRAKSTDPVINENHYRRAYHLLRGAARNRVAAYAEEEGRFDRPHEAREAVIRSVLKQSDQTYQVRWSERRYRKGQLAGEGDFTGLFRVAIAPQRDVAALMNNPFGLFIHEISWQQELQE